MITAGAIHYLIIREGSAFKRHSGLEPSLHILNEPLRVDRTDHLTWADLLSYASPRAEPSRLLFPSYVFALFILLGISPGSFESFRFERSHIDGEAVLYIGLEESVVGFVDLLYGNEFDIGGDVVCSAKVEHLLCLRDTADG